MECQPSDSKKLFKVFDASKRKHTRKKREGFDDNNSLATDDSTNACQGNNGRRVVSNSSMQDLSTNIIADSKPEVNSAQRNRNSSSPSVSPDERASRRSRRSSRSPQQYRRLTRDGISLALKAGLVSTPCSGSPRQDNGGIETVGHDQDSFIYAFLEEAVKRDKRKRRHARRQDEKRGSRDGARSPSQEQNHHRRRHRHREEHSKEMEKHRYVKEEPVREPPIDQMTLLATFAKLCAQFKEKTPNVGVKQPACVQSHKSLQCEPVGRRDSCNLGHGPDRLHNRRASRDNMSPSRIRSHDNFHSRVTNVVETNVHPDNLKSQCVCYSYDKETPKYASKLNMASSKIHNIDTKYHDYSRDKTPTRSCVDYPYYRPHPNDGREYRDYDDRRKPTRDGPYEDRRVEQKTSRSCNIQRDRYDDRAQRTVRSDYNRERVFYGDPRDYRDMRYADSPRDKYYDEKPTRDRNFSHKERSRRNLERMERNSIASRDDDYRERFSEKERDSGLSVADGEMSTISGRSNCLRVVKQEISEQREAMDKMMKLWKELMRCFKGVSQTQGQERGVQESAANVQESAAAQLRLWRECMRRYETVARDVGDTDARLMEEINKQRLEMTEMANMWQECLQRYRDMSNDFNTLKSQLSMPESPSRAPPAPPVCAEGERAPPPAPYRLPPNYPPMGLQYAAAAFDGGGSMMGPPHAAAAYGGGGGSPLRQRASAPPAWWWAEPRSPRRRSSPESRGSRERRHRHRDRDRDDTRYKEKAKPSGARSEHKHKKR